MTQRTPALDTRDREYWLRQLMYWDRHPEAQNFNAHLFRAMSFADPDNFFQLSLAFPLACQVFEAWVVRPACHQDAGDPEK